MIHLEERHKKIVQEILSRYPYKFYAFGSRVRGTHKRFSDLDLCCMDSLSLNVASHIDGDFEESDLPFKVDVVDWHRCSKDFRSLIEKEMVLFE